MSHETNPSIDPGGGAGELRVGYLASTHPAISQAFIQREVDGLRALGVDVTTFSVRPTPQAQLLDTTMLAEAERTTVLQGDRAAVAVAVGEAVRERAGGFARVLARALRTGDRTLRTRTWQAFYLAEAARLHSAMRAQGLRQLHVHFANNAADIARLTIALGRALDGPDAGWCWSFSMHGPTEFEAVDRFDLAGKVRDADAVACISDFARSQLMRLVDPPAWNKLHIVRMSVDLETFKPPETDRQHDGPFRVLSVGRLVPEKGAPLLLEALARLRDRGIDVHARIAGGGELEPYLRRQTTELGLSGSVELLGPVSQETVRDLYQWADTFCLPSFQEGLPVVLMEAMATELPVVTTAIAGIPELVVDDETGVLVSAGRADLVADGLARLAAEPAERQRLGRAARDRVVAEFSSEVNARRQLQFLASIGAAH